MTRGSVFREEAACRVPTQRPEEAVFPVFASGHGLRSTQGYANISRMAVQERLRKMARSRGYTAFAIALSGPTTLRSSDCEPSIASKWRDVSWSSVSSSSLIAPMASGRFMPKWPAPEDSISRIREPQ